MQYCVPSTHNTFTHAACAHKGYTHTYTQIQEVGGWWPPLSHQQQKESAAFSVLQHALSSVHGRLSVVCRLACILICMHIICICEFDSINVCLYWCVCLSERMSRSISVFLILRMHSTVSVCFQALVGVWGRFIFQLICRENAHWCVCVCLLEISFFSTSRLVFSVLVLWLYYFVFYVFTLL